MWDTFLDVCTVVGMLTIYAVVVGAGMVWASRALKRRRAKLSGRYADGAPGGIDRRARSWGELPEWVSQDREWAAAIVVLGTAEIAERTQPHVDFGRRQVRWEPLREAARDWDEHARTLVEVADALAHAEPPPSALRLRGVDRPASPA